MIYKEQMIILTKLKMLDKARKRAMELNPSVDLIEFGRYTVTGSKSNIYEVTCKTDGLNNRIVFCSCEERYPRKLNEACYHIAAALSLHLYLCEGRVLTFGKDRAEAIWISNL